MPRATPVVPFRVNTRRFHAANLAQQAPSRQDVYDTVVLEGRLPEAERLYEAVLVRQPESIEAWFQLAEVRFHYGALYGRSALESGTAWMHLLTLNPDHRGGLIHMAAVAALRGDAVAVDSIEALVNPEEGSSVVAPQIRALKIFTSGSDADRESFLDELARYGVAAFTSTSGYASRYLRSPETGSAIARLLIDETRPAAEQAEGNTLLAYFAVASGRPEEARRELDRATALGVDGVEVHRLLLATLPGAPVSLRHGSGAVVDAMPRVVGDRAAGGPVTFDGSVPSALRVYARALAYHASGGEDGAISSAAHQLIDPAAGSADFPLREALSRGLTAERHLAHGDTTAGRNELDAAVLGVERWYEHLRESHLRSLARERFLLAESEGALGERARAEGLLSALGDNAVSELPYRVPSLFRVGELRERRGDLDGARAAYQEALALWHDAEPVLAPLVAELQARVAVLQARMAALTAGTDHG